MTRRAPKPLPPPIMQERAVAAQAARALRAVIADKTKLGRKSVTHFDFARPRRAEWWTTWSGLPGLTRINGRFSHDCLPGWTYAKAEVRSEMIPDLERLAEFGERPSEASAALEACA